MSALVQRYVDGGNALAASRASVSNAASPSATGTWTTVSSTQFVYDDQGHLLGEYDSKKGYSQETVWFNGQPVATVMAGRLYYIFADHLGSPRSIVRATTGAEVWRWGTEPFGSSVPVIGASEPTFSYNLRIPGQYYDSYTGYHYNGMRYYDPQTGRYLQADPIGLAGGLSRYAYVGGNTLLRTDPTGLYWFRQEWQASDPIVGRQNTFIAPGGPISSFVERYVPAGRTLAEIHDPMVDTFTGLGVPDWLSNFPTMPSAYASAIGLEILRSLGFAKQPSPPNMCPR